MKSLKDLQKIKDEVIKETNLRHYKEGYKVIVAMGEVGLELGARKVLNALAQETYDNNLRDVTVLMDGKMPIVEADGVVVKVVAPDGEETLYGKVCPVCAKKIITEHVMKGQKVEDLVITKFGE